MSNVRIVYSNAADTATVTSSITAANLSSANLTNDIKSKVCRSVGTTLAITLVWPSAESISCVAMAFTNFSAAATMHVQGYAEVVDNVAVYDQTGLCSQGSVSKGQGVNSFAYGGGVYARHWLTSAVTVKKLVITITDAANAQGYVEAGRLIAGLAWVPSFGVEQDGTTMTLVDASEHVRTDAGDMHVNVKPRYRKQNLVMPSLDKLDRARMWRVLYNNGIVKPIFLSVYPNNADAELEQVHMMYGRLVTSPVMQTPYWNHNSATLEIEEI